MVQEEIGTGIGGSALRRSNVLTIQSQGFQMLQCRCCEGVDDRVEAKKIYLI